jgi:hypothetical protein
MQVFKHRWSLTAGILVLVGGCIALGDLLVAQDFDDAMPLTLTVEGPALYMSGEITPDTDDAFAAVIAANPQITTLIACEIPGSLDDETMIALSYRVRELGLKTHLTARSLVASGGTDLFLAGTVRTIADGAKIGVHSWSDGENDAADFPRSSPEHAANRQYIADMLGDDAFYWFTIYAAPADDMYWMTANDIATYGLATQAAASEAGFECP